MNNYLLIELCETRRLLIVHRADAVYWAEPFVTVDGLCGVLVGEPIETDKGDRRGVLVGEFPTYAQAHDEKQRVTWARRGLPVNVG